MIVGREQERGAIARLTDGARAGAGGALVVRGAPGVGKTTLLADAAGRADGLTVLRAVGVDAEAEIAFAAIDQALRPLRHLVGGLSPERAAALAGAVGSEDAHADRYSVALAALDLLSLAAERAARAAARGRRAPRRPPVRRRVPVHRPAAAGRAHRAGRGDARRPRVAAALRGRRDRRARARGPARGRRDGAAERAAPARRAPRRRGAGAARRAATRSPSRPPLGCSRTSSSPAAPRCRRASRPARR